MVVVVGYRCGRGAPTVGDAEASFREHNAAGADVLDQDADLLGCTTMSRGLTGS
jgi:hypothetical protein